MKQIARLALVFFASLGLIATAAADVYRVGGIAVDETAQNITQARDAARAQARLIAASQLIERLTLPEDRQGAAMPLDPAELARFYNSIDTDGDEKYTATRYISVLAVNFDAEAVRNYFDAHGVPFVDGQAGLALLVPMAGQGLDPVTWGGAWTETDDDTMLTPYVVSQESWDRPVTWPDVAAEAGARRAARAIVAAGYVSNGQLYVRLRELTPNGQESAIAVAGPFASLDAARQGAVEALEREWKRASVVRTTGSTVMDVVADFTDLRQWVAIRRGVEASRIVSDLQVQSISTRGADLSFVFAGRPDQLAADLRSRGLQLSGSDAGWTISTAGGR